MFTHSTPGISCTTTTKWPNLCNFPMLGAHSKSPHQSTHKKSLCRIGGTWDLTKQTAFCLEPSCSSPEEGCEAPSPPLSPLPMPSPHSPTHSFFPLLQNTYVEHGVETVKLHAHRAAGSSSHISYYTSGSKYVYLLKLRNRKGDSQIKKRLPVSSSVVGA